MTITKQNIFEVMFSGLGNGIGLDLTERVTNPELLLTTKISKKESEIVGEFIDELYKKRGRPSFIPTGKEAMEFLTKWENAYQPAITQFNNLTEKVMKELFPKGIPEPQYTNNEFDYMMAIQNIYRNNHEKIDHKITQRFNAFNNSITLHRNLENIESKHNLRYSKNKGDLASVVSARPKHCESIGGKLPQKIINLAEKRKSCKRAKEEFQVIYDDLLITDAIGFLVASQNPKKIPLIPLIKKLGLKIMEEKSSEREGYHQQIKTIDRNGIIYEIRIYDMEGLISDYFEKPEFTNRTRESHALYKKRKIREVLKKDQKNEKVYDDIRYEVTNLLAGHCNAKVKETVYDVFLTKQGKKKDDFLEQMTEDTIRMMKIYRSHPERRKKEGITKKRIDYFLSQIKQCYMTEIQQYTPRANTPPKLETIEKGLEKIENAYQNFIEKEYKIEPEIKQEINKLKTAIRT